MQKLKTKLYRELRVIVHVYINIQFFF